MVLGVALRSWGGSMSKTFGRAPDSWSAYEVLGLPHDVSASEVRRDVTARVPRVPSRSAGAQPVQALRVCYVNAYRPVQRVGAPPRAAYNREGRHEP